MKILFYQLDSKYERLEAWKQGKYFGHPLFGATHFPKYGIDVVMSRNPYDGFYKKLKKIIKLDLRMVCHSLGMLFTARKYDAVYGPYPKGLGLLMFFRSIGLFNKPIVIFSHQGIPNPKGGLKKFLVKQAYKGTDKVLFFSQLHFDEARQTGICAPSKLFKINWGPDLEFYDRSVAAMPPAKTDFFISTGKAKRDYDTLVSAFAKTDVPLLLYVDTHELESTYAGKAPNVNVTYLPVTPTSPSILINSLNDAIALSICTKKAKGLIGITNMYEAMALNKPVIITKNPAIDIDVDKEGIGISIDLDDVEGWKRSIEYLYNNPEIAAEMGRKGRELCEKKLNLDIFSGEVVEILKK
ncbi:glycosyltransferase family 4 protein [Mucilaginibacter celer]|uniref:Glycosyltransferase family 1 protein n=1 Tax=Mucilaginibacter celer TaxID=2305508 RepID=A0A494W052_9SPHI|nr:glycosyltransferase family 4 protein [Mucilaginibacter celer]AYL97123.1 glycosyltransferase family 1 protein [Mucilaginibacter celer]